MSASLDIDDILLEHAAGRLSPAVSLLVDSHVALSPRSCAIYHAYEEIGGALLETCEQSPLKAGAWDRLCEQLDNEPATEPEHRSPPTAFADFPSALRAVLPAKESDLPWRHFGPVSEAAINVGGGDERVSIVRVRAGRSVPQHTHVGDELTLVLRGGFRDGDKHFVCGDMVIADHDVNHRPLADPETDCWCLTVTDAPVRLTGPLSRFLNPLLRLS